MEISKRSLIIFCLGWVTFLVLTSYVAGYYYMEFQNLTKLLEKYRSCVMHVNICIDYKEWNETVVWYNDTFVPLGCDLLQATEMIAIVNCTTYPGLGYFVDAINGVWKTSTRFWMWYQWKNEWVYGPCGAGSYLLSNGEIVMWQYEIPSYS